MSAMPTTPIVQMVPIDRIHILNARSRSKVRFREIIENIHRVGLKKPITVSRKEGEDGFDLVYGQGRLEAYQALGATEIPALIVDLPLEDRLLQSLVENLTRRTPSSLELVRHLTQLQERGHGPAEIAVMVGLSRSYLHGLLRLVADGEERLVKAVDRGDIPIRVALTIASTEDKELQHTLQEAYERGELRGRELLKVRRLVEERRSLGKGCRLSGVSRTQATPSSQDLVRTLKRETQRQELLVRKARRCEQQLRFVLSALRSLLKEAAFVELLRAERLEAMPKILSELVPP